MKNLRKLLTVVIALAIVLSSVSMAFASSIAPAADIEDEDVKSAVERLAALGIVAGKEDGKFHENDTLTRDEFAKMLVVALNLENAANASKSAQKFSDVPSTVWSAGYVNVAAAKNLVKGRPDGTFGRLDPVTPAEAITMLVRALGYKDEWLEGTWPANMVNKADEIGMLDDLVIGDGPATRGLAAQLLNNTLEIPMVKQTGFGTDAVFELTGDTILDDKLGVDEFSGVVTNVPKFDEDLDEDEITIDSDENAFDDDYAVVQEGIDVDALFGKEITVLSDGDDILLVTVDTSADNIVVGAITAVDDADDTITIQGADGEDADYTISNSAVVFINNASSNDLDALGSDDLGIYGTFIIDDDDEVLYADLLKWNTGANDIYVSEVDTEKEFIRGYKASYSSASKFALDDYDGVKYFGDAASLDEIEVGDIAYIADVAYRGDDYAYVYVVRNTVEGELTRAASDGSSIKIGTVSYNVDNAKATASFDDDGEIVDFANAASVADAIGEEVVVYLDIIGQVRHITTSVNATSSVQYGVITRVFTNNSGDQVARIFDAATGENVTYVYDDTEYTNLQVTDIVAFTLNSDNEIDTISVINRALAVDDPITDIDADLSAYTGVDTDAPDAFNSDYDYLTTNAGAKLYIADDTLILDGTDLSDPSVVEWADIEDKENTAAITMSYVADGNVAKFIVFTAGYTLTTDDYTLAVVTERYYDGDQKAVLDVIGSDDDVDLVLDAGVNFDEKDVVVYRLNSDDEIDGAVVAVSGAVYADAPADMLIGADDTEFDVITATVTSFSGNILKFTQIDTTELADTSFRLNSDVEVYLLTLDGADADSIEKGDLGDITDGQIVHIITNSDKEPVMVIIVD